MLDRRQMLAALGSSTLAGRVSAATPAKPFRILSIDGGGLRGIVAARILMDLDQRLVDAGRPSVAEAFDMFAGTSTGCIIAAGLAAAGAATQRGLPSYANPKDIVRIYEEAAPIIFEPHRALRERLRRNIIDWWGPSYSIEAKREVLRRTFGEIRLSDLSRNFMGTFYSMGSRVPGDGLTPGAVIAHGGPLFAGKLTGRHDRLLWEVVHASSSAPVLFDPVDIDERSAVAVDGGVFANNPSAMAYFDAGAAAVPTDGIEIVSIGCGAQIASYPPTGTWGPVEWAVPRRGIPIITVMMDSQGSSVDQALLNFMGEDRYLRLQPTVNYGKDARGRQLGRMDDPRPVNLKEMISQAEAFLSQEDTKARMARFVARVTPRTGPAKDDTREFPVG
jgi:predicted acylesterase/phospholipase RssA